METFFYSALQYILDVLVATFHQLMILFGPLILLAFLMHLISGYSARLGARAFGPKTFFYLFMLIGTAVHETSHAIFALLFGHKVTKIELFSGDPTSENPGSVTHEYNSKNLYQNMGNFFIGIGPILFGSLFLFLLSYLLFGFGYRHMVLSNINIESFTELSSLKAIGLSIVDNFGTYLHLVFYGDRSSWWKIVILIYLLYAVGSSVSLSPSDINGSASGFAVFLVVLLLFNLVTLWIGDFTLNFFRTIGFYFSGLYLLLILSVMINLIFILVLMIPVRLFNRGG
jgi:hypothetical protein